LTASRREAARSDLENWDAVWKALAATCSAEKASLVVNESANVHVAVDGLEDIAPNPGRILVEVIEWDVRPAARGGHNPAFGRFQDRAAENHR
jgi:hypothetical protein